MIVPFQGTPGNAGRHLLIVTTEGAASSQGAEGRWQGYYWTFFRIVPHMKELFGPKCKNEGEESLKRMLKGWWLSWIRTDPFQCLFRAHLYEWKINRSSLKVAGNHGENGRCRAGNVAQLVECLLSMPAFRKWDWEDQKPKIILILGYITSWVQGQPGIYGTHSLSLLPAPNKRKYDPKLNCTLGFEKCMTTYSQHQSGRGVHAWSWNIDDTSIGSLGSEQSEPCDIHNIPNLTWRIHETYCGPPTPQGAGRSQGCPELVYSFLRRLPPCLKQEGNSMNRK